jgi:hypothetical protein
MAAVTEKSHTRNRVALAALAGIVLVGIVYLIWGLQRPPQMGDDEEVFKTVDALFTAVTARDEKLLADCEKRLHGHKSSGRLPADAAKRLDQVIAQARRGQWEPASRLLYDFMIGQRREGRAVQKKTVD